MFLLIDNYDSFTFNLVQAFQTLGVNPRVVRNDDPGLLELASRPDLIGVCISPGAGHPDNAGLCLEFLLKLPITVPVLGVCLGHQVLGRFAGVKVSVGPHIMHGKATPIMHDGQGLFKGLPVPMRVGRYHSLLVEVDEDRSALIVTARTPEGEVMGMRYADRPWTGVQFHPESVLTPDGVRLLGNFVSLMRHGAGEDAACDAKHASDSLAAPTPPRLSTILDMIANGEDLSPDLAHAGFSRLMDGEMSPGQAGAFLLGLRAKGETPEEMVQAVEAVLERAVPVTVPQSFPVIDVVGTGGDGRSSFNCSTGTALTLAALGHRVLKHGNRSVSSQCGSADVLEGFGLDLDPHPEDIPARLEDERFVFLFAPRFHPAFQHIMPIRRELGVRTLFNLLGPLVNPARPGVCFLGVPRPELLPLLAHTLARMGNRTGAIVHGAGGYDELTTIGPADVAYVNGPDVTFATLDPAEFGFTPTTPGALAISGPVEGVAVLRELLDGKGPDAMRQMLALNTGFGLYLLQREKPLAACMAEAKSAVAQGAGGKFLRKILTMQENRQAMDAQNAPLAPPPGVSVTPTAGRMAGGSRA